MRRRPLLSAMLCTAIVGCDAQPAMPRDSAPPAPASVSRPAADVPPAPSSGAEAEADNDAGRGTSRYTSIAKADCRVVDVDREAGGYRALCAGVPGYGLAVLEGDARMTLNVIAGDGGEHPLQLSSRISSAFSGLGERVEWRYMDSEASPAALIVRFDANEDPEQPERITSYLAVAKLAGGRPCVIAKIDPGAGQNERARAAADAATDMPCL